MSVSENTFFLIDVEEVDLPDLDADDTDSWHLSRTKKVIFLLVPFIHLVSVMDLQSIDSSAVSSHFPSLS